MQSLNMDRWKGKVALVTGASSGIGAGIAQALAKHGLKVIGVARNITKIQEFSAKLTNAEGSLTGIACDVTKEDQVVELFEEIENKFGTVQLCVNNAGMSYPHSLLEGSSSEWQNMMNLNVVSGCNISKRVVQNMTKKGIQQGHIINIASILSHQVPQMESLHFLSATKFAVKAVSEGLRQELRQRNSRIKLTIISPGLVVTDFCNRMLGDETEANKIYEDIVALQPEDIAESVVHALSAPTHVEINEIVITPISTKEL